MSFFSIIIPTRNRPEIVSVAVNSVLAQSFTDYEIIVVDDGSERGLSTEDMNLSVNPSDRLTIVNLERRNRGRGPSYARNVGVWSSSGTYCAFLDDDDEWICEEHLARAFAAIGARNGDMTLYLSNQEAYSAATGTTDNLWLYPLGEMLADSNRAADGCYQVSADDLIRCGGFSHLNTTIVRRELFDSVGGLDEYISYEEDLDFYLRVIDKAEMILFNPEIVSRHYIPDRTKKDNASTSVDALGKLNIRQFILTKNMLSAQHQSIVQYCLEYTVSTYKNMAEACLAQGDFRQAAQFARRGLGASFSFKWFLYCLFLQGKSWMVGGRG